MPAIGQSISALRELLVKQGTAEQREIVGRFNNLVGKKLAEMEATLDLYEKQGAGAAQTLTETGIGQRAMTAIRDEVDQLSATHRRQFEEAASRWSNDVRFARLRHAGHDPGDGRAAAGRCGRSCGGTCVRASSAA